MKVAALLVATVVSLVSMPGQGVGQKAASAPAPPPTPPARVRAKLDGFDLSAKAGKTANQIGGASRDLGAHLYAPAMAKAYSLTPTFYWAAPDGAPKVTFRLSTINGVTLYETVTTEDHLTYPADAPALAAGATYRWTVIPETQLLGEPPKPVTMLIVGSGEYAEITQALTETKDIAGVFVDHRIWYDAVAVYTKALEQNPLDQAALKGRAALYDQLDVTHSLADADWKKVQ